jgi:hypothetical protein
MWNSIFLEETRDTWGCLQMHACTHHTHKHRHRSAITQVCSMSERETMILWETAVHHFTPHSLHCIMYRYIEQTLASWSDSAQFGTAGHLALVSVKPKTCSMCLTALCLFPSVKCAVCSGPFKVAVGRLPSLMQRWQFDRVIGGVEHPHM